MNLQLLDKISFPKPNGIMINMMPFIIGDKDSIPLEYRHYWSLLDKCKVAPEEIGKIGFLSINESLVESGKSQRRGGIHVEKHPNGNWGGDGGGAWGGKGGLFLASNVNNSCKAWDIHVETPGEGGNCEHLKSELKNEIMLPANQIVWMTDSCPHQALEVHESVYRQWLRFVTSNVSLWYQKHSTPNRLGIEPNCKIIKESKFK